MDKKTIILTVAVVALLAVIGLFSPDYKRKTETIEHLEQTVATSQAESVSMKSVIENLRETVKRSSVSGSVKEPVQMAGNVVAYREVKWRTTNTESVKESVKQALEESRQASSSHSESVTVTNTKKETVIKRGIAEFGIGVSTEGEKAAFVGIKVLGPLGAWGVAEGVKIVPSRACFGVKLTL